MDSKIRDFDCPTSVSLVQNYSQNKETNPPKVAHYCFRYLQHENVVTIFGAARVNVFHSSNNYTFIFVMELCQENLKSFICNDNRNVPALSSDTKQAIQTFLKWAIEIADGLNYIHEKGLVHRHLKLENILVSITLYFNSENEAI